VRRGVARRERDWQRPLSREPVLWASPIVLLTTVTPFVFGYDSVPALSNHIAFAAAIVPLALVGAGLPPAAFLTGIAGAWLAVSPFALGYADEGFFAWSIDLVAGIAVVVLGMRSALPLRERTINRLELLEGRRD
jgi:hypothetical protein